MQAPKFMILWANWLRGITNHADVLRVSVRFNVLGLLARNLLQGGKEQHSEVLMVMCLTPHLISPQHHLFVEKLEIIVPRWVALFRNNSLFQAPRFIDGVTDN